MRPSASYGRAYEFLNAENFPHFAANTLNPFTVSMGLIQVPQTEIPVNIDYQGDMYALGVNISGPTLSKQERKNVVLTVLLDISGSMDGSYAREVRNDVRTLLDVAKHGLTQMMSSLKEGDVLNLVTFETSAHIVLTDWQFDATDSTYTDVVNGLATRGSTNLNQGIEYAYTVANASYDPAKANRVVILTDAYANTGEVVPEIIAEKTVINGMEGILFSGVGIGAEFNEGFLNKLTDIGKSTYSAMVTPTDAERIFTGGFMRFVDHAVENIQFRVDYPQSLDQLKSAAEEISTEPSEVSTVNFSYNSSQFFLEMFSGKDVDTSATITLTATFDGADGAPATITLEKTLAELLAENSDQIYAAAAVTTLADLVAGKIDCEAVLASGLYSMNVEADVYVTYIDAITDFCGLAVSTGYSSSSSDVSSYGSVSSASTSSFGYVTGSVSSASSAPIYTYP